MGMVYSKIINSKGKSIQMIKISIFTILFSISIDSIKSQTPSFDWVKQIDGDFRGVSVNINIAS